MLVRTNGYDANGRLTAQWTPAKGRTQFGYDANGNLTSIVYPTMGTVAYGYDALNRLLSVSGPLGNSSFTYANLGAFKSALASEGGRWSGDTVTYGHSGPDLTSIALGSWNESIALDAARRPSSITSPAGHVHEHLQRRRPAVGFVADARRHDHVQL